MTDNNEFECIICLQSNTNNNKVMSPCAHGPYCRECYIQLVQSTRQCALCRYPLLPSSATGTRTILTPPPTVNLGSNSSSSTHSVPNLGTRTFTFGSPPLAPASSSASFGFGSPPLAPASSSVSFGFGSPPSGATTVPSLFGTTNIPSPLSFGNTNFPSFESSNMNNRNNMNNTNNTNRTVPSFNNPNGFRFRRSSNENNQSEQTNQNNQTNQTNQTNSSGTQNQTGRSSTYSSRTTHTINQNSSNPFIQPELQNVLNEMSTNFTQFINGFFTGNPDDSSSFIFNGPNSSIDISNQEIRISFGNQRNPTTNSNSSTNQANPTNSTNSTNSTSSSSSTTSRTNTNRVSQINQTNQTTQSNVQTNLQRNNADSNINIEPRPEPMNNIQNLVNFINLPEHRLVNRNNSNGFYSCNNCRNTVTCENCKKYSYVSTQLNNIVQNLVSNNYNA